MNALLLGLLSGARSLRDVEGISERLTPECRRLTKIGKRISDTKHRDTLLSLSAKECRDALVRQVKGEHQRGQLAPTRVPFGVVAIDGKGLGALSSWAHDDIQAVRPKNQLPYGLARVHRAHLVSADATVCIDTRPIPGKTNEIGAVCDFVQGMIDAYSRTNLFEVITADAGNTSLKLATLLDQQHFGYLLALRQPQGEIYAEARRVFANDPKLEVVLHEKGCRISYRLWRARYAGYLEWGHARQLVRVQRVVRKPDGSTTTGNRFFASNLVHGRLDDQGWLTLTRHHWRCENEGHWTADVLWKEDAKRTPWTTEPEAVYALAALRMIALNILAIFRRRTRRAHTKEPPSWLTVAQEVRYLLRQSAHAGDQLNTIV